MKEEVIKAKEKHLKKEIFKLRVRRDADFFVNSLKICTRAAVGVGVVLVPFVIADSIDKRYAESIVRTEYERMKACISSDGDIQVETQYEDFEDPQSLFTYYSEWQPTENDEYCRFAETYTVDVNKDISGLFDNDIDKIKEILCDKVGSAKEVKRDLNDEVLEQGAYYEAVLYLNNPNKTIGIKPSESEKKEHDIIASLLLISCSTFVASIYVYLRKYGILNVLDWDFDDSIKYDINRRKRDLKELKKSSSESAISKKTWYNI